MQAPAVLVLPIGQAAGTIKFPVAQVHEGSWLAVVPCHSQRHDLVVQLEHLPGHWHAHSVVIPKLCYAAGAELGVELQVTAKCNHCAVLVMSGVLLTYHMFEAATGG